LAVSQWTKTQDGNQTLDDAEGSFSHCPTSFAFDFPQVGGLPHHLSRTKLSLLILLAELIEKKGHKKWRRLEIYPSTMRLDHNAYRSPR
jgi:hypothetical protein